MLIRTCKKSGISDNVVFNKIKGKLQANSHCQKKRYTKSIIVQSRQGKAMTYKEAEQYLLDTPKFTKKNPLENTKAFIKKLGEGMQVHLAGTEQKQETVLSVSGKKEADFIRFEDMENVIHVAGTNGKGSVCAYLNGILSEAGYKVGMFTSPHLVTMRERFRINGEPVSEETFTEAFCYVREQVLSGIKEQMFEHPTFFEFLTGMAFIIFYWEKADILLLETGLGGRLDATNVIKKPLACVITNISLDLQVH